MNPKRDGRGLLRAAAIALALAGGFRGGAVLAQTPDAAADLAGLEAFYDATGGPDWKNRANWKTSAPLGRWHGVTTDASGRVTALSRPGGVRGRLRSGSRCAELQGLVVGAQPTLQESAPFYGADSRPRKRRIAKVGVAVARTAPTIQRTSNGGPG